MLVRTWKKSLRLTLKRLASVRRAVKVAVIGIGHPLCGDDAVGVVVARVLRPLAQGQASLLIIDAGAAPENCTGTLRRFQPDLILMIDAAQMALPCGAIRWLDWHEITGVSASTHALPLSMFASYIIAELGCEIAMLGVQPDSTSLCPTLSPAIKQAACRLTGELAYRLRIERVPVRSSL
ncbi:MAG: hydrogenase 3 maturation endopeptidase HyCI [Anaerolineae bacterium]|nr:hydrogenase 3 maturation endopeptidase HyCI [Anaerolineae bacterium]